VDCGEREQTLHPYVQAYRDCGGWEKYPLTVWNPFLRVAGMKAPLLSARPVRTIALYLFAITTASSAANPADAPELEKLRLSYKTAVAKGTKSLLLSHITTLEKLRDIYTRGSNLQGATKVQTDIDRAKVAMSTGEFLPPAADPNNTTAPELDKLRAGHDGSIERALKPFRETYARELDKLRDSYTRAANLAAATAVQEELDGVKSDGPQGGPERFFAGKSWWTPVNSEYRFGRGESGERIDVKGVKTAFTWRKLKTGMVEVTGSLTPGGPAVNWYFKFDNTKTALMGDNPNSLPWACRADK
jgi:hypothetical protein